MPLADNTDAEEKLSIFSQGPVVVVEWSLADGWPIIAASDNYQELLPYTSRQLELQPCFAELVHLEDLPRVTDEVERYLTERRDSWDQYYRISDGQGGYRWIFDRTHASYDKNGQLVSLWGYLLDQNDMVEALHGEERNRARFQSMAELTGSLVWECGRDGLLTYVSGNVQDVLGADFRELVNRCRFYELDGVQHDTAWQLLMQEALNAGKPFQNITHPLYHINGDKRWFSSSVQVNTDRDMPAIPYYRGISIDISQQKLQEAQVADQEARFRVAMEATGIGMWRWDLCTDEVQWSDQAYEQLGFDPGLFQITLERFLEMMHPDDREFVLETVYQQIEQEKQFAVQFRLKNAQGNWVWIDGRGRTTEHDETGKPIVMMGTHTNIDRIKESEAALNAAREEAERATKEKSAFLSNMSHEIRTPMSGIIGLSELGLNESDPEVMRQQLSRIHQTANHLLDILNGILDFEKLAGGHVEINPRAFELKGMMDGITSLFEQTARRKGLSLITEIDAGLSDFYEGDELRLRQVVSNLVSNAIKFTEQGQVTLTIRNRSSQNASDILYFSVCDSGVGIAPEVQKTLFQPFVQGGKDITRHHGGTGLGLAISQHLVRLMGGENIEVESEPGQGSCFTFVLPLKPVSKSDWSRQQPVEREQRQEQFEGRVLVAEDNEVNQEVARVQLERLGLTVVVVPDGRQAVDAARKEAFDLILMDIQMPIMDGLEATRIIRATNPSVPIVALTAAVLPEDRQQALDAGMNGVLGKPFRSNDLIQVVARWVGMDQLGQMSASNSQTKPGLPARDKLLDVDWALEQLGGNDSLYRSLLAEFLNELKTDYSTLASDISTGWANHSEDRLEHWQRETHRLKGTAGNLGAMALSLAASSVNDYLKEGRMPPTPDLGDALVKALSDTRVKLQETLDGAQRAKAETGDESCQDAGSESLQTLLALIKRNEFMDEAELARYDQVIEPDEAGKWQQVKAALNNLEFGQAQTALQQLLRARGEG